jgi:acyl dehydratase
MTVGEPEGVTETHGPSAHFEDFTVGRIIPTARRTITEADLATFIGLGGFFEEIFMCTDSSVATPFEGRVVPGYLTLVVAEGLFTLTGMMHHAVGLLSLDGARWIEPVKCGDTLRVEITIAAARRTRRGDRGVVTSSHRVLRQDGQPVLTYETSRMILMRSTDAPPPETQPSTE